MAKILEIGDIRILNLIDSDGHLCIWHCNHILNSNEQLKTDIEKARLDLALYGTATVNIEEQE